MPGACSRSGRAMGRREQLRGHTEMRGILRQLRKSRPLMAEIGTSAKVEGRSYCSLERGCRIQFRAEVTRGCSGSDLDLSAQRDRASTTLAMLRENRDLTPITT